MNYQITSDNISISPSMKSLAKDKLDKIDRILSDVNEDSKSVRVVMNKASDKDDTFEVKILLNADGKEYFSNHIDYTLESAVVNTVEELARMLRKDKKY